MRASSQLSSHHAQQIGNTGISEIATSIRIDRHWPHIGHECQFWSSKRNSMDFTPRWIAESTETSPFYQYTNSIHVRINRRSNYLCRNLECSYGTLQRIHYIFTNKILATGIWTSAHAKKLRKLCISFRLCQNGGHVCMRIKTDCNMIINCVRFCFLTILSGLYLHTNLNLFMLPWLHYHWHRRMGIAIACLVGVDIIVFSNKRFDRG